MRPAGTGQQGPFTMWPWSEGRFYCHRDQTVAGIQWGTDMMQLYFSMLSSATGWRLEGREAITHTGRLVKGQD